MVAKSNRVFSAKRQREICMIRSENCLNSQLDVFILTEFSQRGSDEMEQLCIHLCYSDETRCKISNLCTCCICNSLCFHTSVTC